MFSHQRLSHNHHHHYVVWSFVIFLKTVVALVALADALSSHNAIVSSSSSISSVPIVLSIAGSDSGGGAGIQADLHAIHSFGCHGCTAITCVTAQNSVGVSGVHQIPSKFLRQQLDAVLEDLPPTSIKIGMIYSSDNAKEIGNFLASSNSRQPAWVVCDPVMISTSGHALISEETKKNMIESVFPYTDVLTPNKFEAEALLGRKLKTFADVEQGARDILDTMSVASVLIKGGHPLDDDDGDVSSSYSQDYFLSRNIKNTKQERRLCDGEYGVWLRSPRIDSLNTHGTGCTLSSSIAAALALGRHKGSIIDTSGSSSGSSAIDDILDACCLAKSYVTAGIHHGVQLGKGPGPVAHTNFPSTYQYYTTVAFNPKVKGNDSFLPMIAPSLSGTSAASSSADSVLGKIMPIVDSAAWVKALCSIPGITDIQLRLKGVEKKEDIASIIQQAQDHVANSCARLWINDYWKEAIAAKCFGVHLGQKDLASCAAQGGLEILQKLNMALGISTHTYAELSVALSVRPTYISLGPVFDTTSKNVQFGPQGLSTVSKWRSLIPPNIPLVAIGGIGDPNTARLVKDAGADCVAVIGAVTKAQDLESIVQRLNEAME